MWSRDPFHPGIRAWTFRDSVTSSDMLRSKLLRQKSRVISCNLEVDDHYLDSTFLYYRPEGTRFHSSVGSKQVRSKIEIF